MDLVIVEIWSLARFDKHNSPTPNLTFRGAIG
jgi:hypothetical protein